MSHNVDKLYEAGIDPLTPEHRHELEVGSKILPEVIRFRGYRSVKIHQVAHKFAGNGDSDGLYIPIYNPDGHLVSAQFKPDIPRVEMGRTIKYEGIVGVPPVIDLPNYALPHIEDPNTPLWITEGAKKADSAVSNGIKCIISLQGVYGWRGTNASGGKTALPDWEAIALNQRSVILAFDSDCMTKPQVRTALERLEAFLTSRGAEVAYCLMPHLPDGAKCGLDDFFASGRTLSDLFGHVTRKLPPLESAAEEMPIPDLLLLDDVAPQEIDWLWTGWLPRRMLTLLGGLGGDGKSTIMASLIGALTTGGALPDGTQAPLTNVLMLCAEDDVAYAVRPRCDLHGADPKRVFVLRGSFGQDGSTRWLDIRRDVRLMRAVIEKNNIGLVVVDPLSSYLPNADRNSEGDIRDALQPLLGLMDETGVAIAGIMHVGKSGDGRRAQQRLLGSTAFTALARSVLMVADAPDDQQPEDAEREGKLKVLQVVKSNYAIVPPPRAFRRPLNAPLSWQGVAPVGIEECLTATPGNRGPEPAERRDAESLLREMLANGPVAATEILDHAKSLGISPRTMRRVKKILGVYVTKAGYQGAWQWQLPGTLFAPKDARPTP